MTIAAKSASDPRFSAATVPSGMPIRQVTIIAARASETVYGSESRMIATTSCFFESE